MQNKLENHLRVSKSTFYEIMKSEEISHIVFSKREKSLCDLFCTLNNSISGLVTRNDINSRAKMILLEQTLHNHIMRHRMGRFLYKMCISRARNSARPIHELESNIDSLIGYNLDNVQYTELQRELSVMREEGELEEATPFIVNPPCSQGDSVGMISWDFSSHLSTPRNLFEKMQEHFAATFGYNIYLFGLVDEMKGIQHNYVYGEENPSKGSNVVASIVLYFLRNQAPEYLRTVSHLIICTD